MAKVLCGLVYIRTTVVDSPFGKLARKLPLEKVTAFSF